MIGVEASATGKDGDDVTVALERVDNRTLRVIVLGKGHRDDRVRLFSLVAFSSPRRSACMTKGYGFVFMRARYRFSSSVRLGVPSHVCRVFFARW